MKPLDAQYGRWRVTGRDGHFALCVCECGTTRRVDTGRLRAGESKSCGCLSRELARARGHSKVTHRMTGSTEYSIWQHMNCRCHVPSTDGYAHYGARGIAVCERWRDSFENFYADMGPRPSCAHTLDRRDNDAGYSPGNCRWATSEQQHRNMRSNHPITAFGETKLICEWLEDSRCAVGGNTLRGRIRRGLDPEASIALPPVPRMANEARRAAFSKRGDRVMENRWASPALRPGRAV